jgi:hypothetical protein
MSDYNPHQERTFQDPHDPGSPAPPSGSPGRRPRQGRQPLILVAVALVAAAIGIGTALVFLKGPSATPASSSSAMPAAGGAHVPSSGSAGGGAGALPPLSGGGGQLQLLLNGRVTAISATSITIGGNGPSVTASITSSTKVTGKVTGISGVKVGDQIAVQVSGASPAHLTVNTIQDPGQGP